MVGVFREDGCSYAAGKKYKGEYADMQVNFEKELSDVLISKSLPLEEEAKTLFPRIKHQLDMGNITLVIGAGVSISCGLPAWDELVKKVFVDLLISKGLYENEILDTVYSMNFKQNLMQLTQSLTAIFSEEEIASAVKKVFLKKSIKKSMLLNAVCDFIEYLIKVNDILGKSTSVLTFNYDMIIEKELAKRNIIMQSCSRNFENKTMPQCQHNIIHIHGSIASKDNKGIVLSEHSYGEAYLCKTYLDPLSRAIDEGQIPLFVGFSFNDTFVRQILYKHSIERDELVAVGLLAKQDLIKNNEIKVSNEYSSCFTPNDRHGWMVSGKSPLKLHEDTLGRIREQLARVMLSSIGVEWWFADTWEDIPLTLNTLIDSVK
jgi:hypothetical protein